MADYPEHEKLTALNGVNQTVGQWLSSQGWQLARYGRPYEVQAFVDTRELPDGIRRRFTDMRHGLQWDWDLVLEWADEHDALTWREDYADEPGAQHGLNHYLYALPNPDDRDRRWIEERQNEDSLWTPPYRIEALLGEFFGIDPAKLSEEKDAMLAEIRKRAA